MVNAGANASMNSVSFLLASNTGFDEVAQGKDGLIALSYYLGAAIGGLLAGPLGSVAGRRRVLLFGTGLLAVFGVLSAFATNPVQYILCRFLMGNGMGATMPSVSTLVAEHSSSSSRGFYANYADAMWTVGFIYGAFLAWLFLDKEEKIWGTIYQLGTVAPNVLALVLVYFYVPESVRFLAMNGQQKQATKVANWVADSLRFDGDPMTMDEIYHHYPADESGETKRPTLIETYRKTIESYMDLYRIPRRRNRALAAHAIWFLIHMGYGVAQWVSRLFQELEIVDNIYLNSVIFAYGALPGLVFGFYIVDRVSRKVYLQGSLFGTIASVAIFTVLSYLANSAVGIVVVSAIFHSFLVACWAAINLVTVEAFGTHQRNAVLGMSTAFGMLGMSLMNYLSAIILKAEKPLLLLILGTGAIVLVAVLTCSGLLQTHAQGAVLQDTSTPTPSPLDSSSARSNTLDFSSTRGSTRLRMAAREDALRDSLKEEVDTIATGESTGESSSQSMDDGSNDSNANPGFVILYGSSDYDYEIEV